MFRSIHQALVASAVLAALCGQAEGQGAPAAARPNVLIILADDLGYGDLSSYGAADLNTPHIDALVAAGMRFDRFYANCPVCSPTRAALLSGRYPDLVGVPGVIRTRPDESWGYLSRRPELLPKWLKGAGYHTACVGKWHLGLEAPNLPNPRGFDAFRGFLGDMMDDYRTHRRHGINYMRRDAEEVDPTGHATDLFTGWAIDYLNERKGKSEPFFLYLAYNAPHGPIQPPDDWLEKVRKRAPELDEKRAKIAALIEHLDDGVGRVLEALRSNGQAERTLVVFTSDNGGSLPHGSSCGDLHGGKQDMYEGGIRVPFCAVWPGHIEPGSRSDRVALTMDLVPTVAEAAGARLKDPIDGVSILPLLLGRKQPEPDRYLFWMRREGSMRYNGRDYYAVRKGDWKLLQNSPFEPMRLYNLADDPHETHDVSAEKREVVADLSRALRRHLQRAGAVPWQPPRRLGPSPD